MQLTFLTIFLLGLLFLITVIIFNTLLFDKTLAYVRPEKTNLDLKIENIKYRVSSLKTKISGDSF
jgi:hypothetical protein